jgi:hypothetical protein
LSVIRRAYCLLCVVPFVLMACGHDSATPEPPSTAEETPAPISTAIPLDAEPPAEIEDYGLAPGTYRVVVAGPFTGDTTEQGELEPAFFGAYGFGDNHSGDMSLEMKARGFFPDSDVYTDLVVKFIMNDQISPGTHELGASGLIGAYVESGVGVFDSQLSGTLTLDFVNRRWINGSFELSIEHSHAEDLGISGPLSVSGAFHRLPFHLDHEADIRVTGAVEDILSGTTAMRVGPDYTIGFRGAVVKIDLTFTAPPESGEFDVAASDLPFALTIDGVEAENISGTVRFDDDERYLNGDLNIVFQTPDGEAQVSGTFKYFERP